ncbi:MAG: aquaporin [Actinomycetota bacterium]|nr:aquaporin [Actinomycetota bacterium]
MQDRGPAAYVAEFIGTLALVFFVCSAVSLFVSPRFEDFAVIGVVHVFVLFFLIQSLALVSGAHFNPAVTVALAAIRQIKPPDAVIYVVAQLAGAVAAGLLVRALFSEFPNAETQNFGAPGLSVRIAGKLGLGMLAEFLGTFFLVFTIVGVAINPRASKDWAALAIGGALGVGVMTLAPLSGGSFNPARAFGPALVARELGGAGDFLLAYLVAPILGAVAAAFLYVLMFVAPETTDAEGREPAKTDAEGMEPVG